MLIITNIYLKEPEHLPVEHATHEIDATDGKSSEIIIDNEIDFFC